MTLIESFALAVLASLVFLFWSFIILGIPFLIGMYIDPFIGIFSFFFIFIWAWIYTGTNL